MYYFFRSKSIFTTMPLCIMSAIAVISISSCRFYKVKDNAQVGFSPEVLTLLASRCYQCHASGNAEGDFGVMDNYSELLARGYVVPGEPDESILLMKIKGIQEIGIACPMAGPY